MGRTCADCGCYRDRYDFSCNQWRKGPGSSRCPDCLDGTGSHSRAPVYSYQCSECYREFDSQNELKMHMQVHRPRSFSCPVCGDTRFRSGANAVQHVESGSCNGCQGKDNARQQIYNFASQQRSFQPFLNGVPMLTNGNRSSSVPDLPYGCPDCAKNFRQLSQLMQHQDQKHGRGRLQLGR
jgi:predicted nucleic acid-binding Zn ribbon protein